MRNIIVLVGLALFIGIETSAQSIERACLQSDRREKGRALCSCIQQAADLMLSGQDQKLAATFYRDPQKAQDIRQSPSRSHERFWDRYKDYAATASKYCS